MAVIRGWGARYHAARKKVSIPTEHPRVIRPGVSVSCPVCEHYPVRVTKQGLLPHLDCEASGKRVKLDESGIIVLA